MVTNQALCTVMHCAERKNGRRTREERARRKQQPVVQMERRRCGNVYSPEEREGPPLLRQALRLCSWMGSCVERDGPCWSAESCQSCQKVGEFEKDLQVMVMKSSSDVPTQLFPTLQVWLKLTTSVIWPQPLFHRLKCVTISEAEVVQNGTTISDLHCKSRAHFQSLEKYRSPPGLHNAK